MKLATALTAVLVLGVLVAHAGHELTFYPSFYPQEITVHFAAQPSTAATLMGQRTLHAYVGGDPFGRKSGIHWREPYGIYDPVREGGVGDLDEYLETGNRVGLVRATTLFPELEELCPQ